VVKGTKLAKMYENGKYRPLEQEEFVDILIDSLELLPPNAVIQRLMGDPRADELLSPAWSLRKRETLNLIQETLIKRDTWQGKNYFHRG
jgi:radical SAM superfamily enzyme